MRGTLLAVVCGVVLACGCGTAPRQEAAADPDLVFDALDKDRNGSLSLEEFLAMGKDQESLSQLFKRLDKDKNGTLSRGEFKRAGVVLRW